MTEMSSLSDLDATRMRALRNGIYHTMRREFFERWERRFNFAVLALGTATATDFSTRYIGVDANLYTGVATAIVGALQLVYNLGGRARDHSLLQSRFYNLAALAEEPTSDEVSRAKEIDRLFSQLYGEEPPTYHGVNALAYNGAQGAFGRDEQDNLIVPFYLRPFINLFTFSPAWFKTEREQSQRKLRLRSAHSTSLTRSPAS